MSNNNGAGDQRVKEVTTAKRAAGPLLGEAALNQAVADFTANQIAPNASDAAQANASAPKPGQEPAPKTVSQVLGEITWLMT